MTMTTDQLSATRPTSGKAKPRPWWRHPWTAAAVVVVAFIPFALMPYVTLDPGQSRIPVRFDIPLYYPVLIFHIFTAVIALILACLRISTWFKQRYPSAFLASERLYVFAGVVPSAISAFAIGAVSSFGPVTRTSHIMVATLWLVCTIKGYRLGRRGEAEEQRRWMLRSYVLTTAAIVNRMWAVTFLLVLSPQVDALFGGSQQAMLQAISGMSAFLSWTVPLIGLQWWQDSKDAAARRRASSMGS